MVFEGDSGGVGGGNDTQQRDTSQQKSGASQESSLRSGLLLGPQVRVCRARSLSD